MNAMPPDDQLVTDPFEEKIPYSQTGDIPELVELWDRAKNFWNELEPLLPEQSVKDSLNVLARMVELAVYNFEGDQN